MTPWLMVISFIIENPDGHALTDGHLFLSFWRSYPAAETAESEEFYDVN